MVSSITPFSFTPFRILDACADVDGAADALGLDVLLSEIVDEVFDSDGCV
jgi:hypothetical protein